MECSRDFSACLWGLAIARTPEGEGELLKQKVEVGDGAHETDTVSVYIMYTDYTVYNIFAYHILYI